MSAAEAEAGVMAEDESSPLVLMKSDIESVVCRVDLSSARWP
jgi:hypothetical protein